MNDDRALAICADLANTQKHGGLDPVHRPRSGEKPVLSPVKYSAGTANGGIRSIVFAEGGIVEAHFDPEKGVRVGPATGHVVDALIPLQLVEQRGGGFVGRRVRALASAFLEVL